MWRSATETFKPQVVLEPFVWSFYKYGQFLVYIQILLHNVWRGSRGTQTLANDNKFGNLPYKTYVHTMAYISLQSISVFLINSMLAQNILLFAQFMFSCHSSSLNTLAAYAASLYENFFVSFSVLKYLSPFCDQKWCHFKCNLKVRVFHYL